MTQRLCGWSPTRDTVRNVLAPALVFIATSLDRGYQTELWQHLARGRLIAEERAVVSVDRFTYTVPGRELYDNNWLSQLLYHGLHEAGGLPLVQFVNSLALAGAVAGLVALCRRVSGSTACATAAGVLAFFGLWPTLLIRPQTFSIVLFVALYALLTSAARRPRLLVLPPVMMAVWANVHGGFAVGLALIFAFVLAATVRRLVPDLPLPTGERESETQLRPLVACLAFSALATLLNPYGWNVYRYAGRLSAVGVARGIEEWLPPTIGTPIGAAFFASVVLVAALALWSRTRLTALEVCLVGVFALPACFSVRMTVWWHLAAAPVIARLSIGALAPVSRSLRERVRARAREESNGLRPAAPPHPGPLLEGEGESASSRPSPAAAYALAVLATVCVLSLPWLERWNPVLGRLRPAGRTEAELQIVADGLRSQGGARVFTRMEWANYLAWSLNGSCPVFVEGHVELYPDDTWAQYLVVTEGRGEWERLLDEHRVDYLLLDETYHGALLPRVRESPRWRRRASAGPAVLFERRPPAAPGGAAGTVAGGGF